MVEESPWVGLVSGSCVWVVLVGGCGLWAGLVGGWGLWAGLVDGWGPWIRIVSGRRIWLVCGLHTRRCGGSMQLASLMSSYGVIGTLKLLMFFLTSLATFRRRSLLVLIYFSASFPVLSKMISCTAVCHHSEITLCLLDVNTGLQCNNPHPAIERTVTYDC